MPFLYSLSRKGYYIRQIIPCAGFCERSEIFSGLDGYDTGNFTAIGYLPENSPYKNDEWALKWFELIKKGSNRVYCRLFNSWRARNNKKMAVYRIPVKSLSKFALTEDGDKKLVPHRDIFQVLDEVGMTYTMEGFTSLADLKHRSRLTVVELANREIKKRTDFIPLYIGETDSMGHIYGGDMVGMNFILQSVDSQLEEIYRKASSAGYSFCVMGDHGMVPVTKRLDIISTIHDLDCKLHKDYEAFYDSTMARFWFYNNGAKELITNKLKALYSDYGFIVDKTNYQNFRIPLDIYCEDGKPIYGEMVWCANPGIIISPDYFHSAKESENGMHGYVEVVEGHGTGLFVEMFDGIACQEIEKAHSSQVCEELCKSLGIINPNGKGWKRVI